MNLWAGSYQMCKGISLGLDDEHFDTLRLSFKVTAGLQLVCAVSFKPVSGFFPQRYIIGTRCRPCVQEIRLNVKTVRLLPRAYVIGFCSSQGTCMDIIVYIVLPRQCHLKVTDVHFEHHLQSQNVVHNLDLGIFRTEIQYPGIQNSKSRCLVDIKFMQQFGDPFGVTYDIIDI